MDKLLTITIPVYNTEKLLPKCVDSLIRSKYLDKLEIIIVVDGSPDNSKDIAIKYEEKYPKSIIAVIKENGGHGSTINQGIKLAKGKYFRVLDSDDWFDSDEFDKYLNELDGLDVDMVLGNTNHQYIFENRVVPYLYKNVEYNKIFNSDNFNYTDFYNNTFIYIHGVTYSTDILRKSGLILPEKCYYTDVLYAKMIFPWVRSFVFSKNIVYQYLLGREGQSVSKESIRKNIAQHHRISISCAQFLTDYIKNTKQIGDKQKWIINDFIITTSAHIILCASTLKYKDAIREINLYKKELKNINIDIYNKATNCSRANKILRFNTRIGISAIRIFKYIIKLKGTV